jgi:hypothetical protein
MTPILHNQHFKVLEGLAFERIECLTQKALPPLLGAQNDANEGLIGGTLQHSLGNLYNSRGRRKKLCGNPHILLGSCGF